MIFALLDSAVSGVGAVIEAASTVTEVVAESVLDVAETAIEVAVITTDFSFMDND